MKIRAKERRGGETYIRPSTPLPPESIRPVASLSLARQNARSDEIIILIIIMMTITITITITPPPTTTTTAATPPPTTTRTQ